MERLEEQAQDLDDIIFELRCMTFFKRESKEFKNSQLGFMFRDLHLTTKAHFLRLVKQYEKVYGDKLNIKMMEKYQ